MPELTHKNGRPPALSQPGLILLGPSLDLIACNAEAIKILAYPNVSTNKPANVKRVGSLITEKLPAVLADDAACNGPNMGEFLSGRRHYTCTRYVLDMQGQHPPRTVAILLERACSPEVTLYQICKRFNLTAREREAVGYLLQGLTSKEIAQQMSISPNTVKAFLRLVMTKMGVSTRAGLIGRIAGTRPHPSNYVPDHLGREN